jgi:hypothetical protein
VGQLGDRAPRVTSPEPAEAVRAGNRAHGLASKVCGTAVDVVQISGDLALESRHVQVPENALAAVSEGFCPVCPGTPLAGSDQNWCPSCKVTWNIVRGASVSAGERAHGFGLPVRGDHG